MRWQQKNILSKSRVSSTRLAQTHQSFFAKMIDTALPTSPSPRRACSNSSRVITPSWLRSIVSKSRPPLNDPPADAWSPGSGVGLKTRLAHQPGRQRSRAGITTKSKRSFLVVRLTTRARTATLPARLCVWISERTFLVVRFTTHAGTATNQTTILPCRRLLRLVQVPFFTVPVQRLLLMIIRLRDTQAIEHTTPEPRAVPLLFGLGVIFQFGSFPSSFCLFVGFSKVRERLADADNATSHAALHRLQGLLVDVTRCTGHALACSSAHQADSNDDTTNHCETTNADRLDDPILTEIDYFVCLTISLAATGETTSLSWSFVLLRDAASNGKAATCDTCAIICIAIERSSVVIATVIVLCYSRHPRR